MIEVLDYLPIRDAFWVRLILGKRLLLNPTHVVCPKMSVNCYREKSNRPEWRDGGFCWLPAYACGNSPRLASSDDCYYTNK
jgi:hypothetical protein